MEAMAHLVRRSSTIYRFEVVNFHSELLNSQQVIGSLVLLGAMLDAQRQTCAEQD
jgi:hypothetical protein